MVPVELIISGVGLGRFDAKVDADVPDQAAAITLVVHALVTTPLVSAMTVFAVRGLADGEPPRARRLIQAGLDVFRPVFWPMLLVVAAVGATAATAVALIVSVDQALGALVLIALFLVVRLYFVPQAVVAGDARGVEALRASWRLTAGSTLRVAGTLLLATLLLGIAGSVAATPLLAAAQGADSAPLLVLYQAVAQALPAPAVALVATLLYFDLRARRREGGGVR